MFFQAEDSREYSPDVSGDEGRWQQVISLVLATFEEANSR